MHCLAFILFSGLLVTYMSLNVTGTTFANSSYFSSQHLLQEDEETTERVNSKETFKVYFDENNDATTSDDGVRTTEFATDTTVVTVTEEFQSEGTTTSLPEFDRSQQRPHVILIIADDLGFNDVSFHGSPQIPTPNIDALAFSGVILNSYYVSPICTPSRTALYSGRHPIHTGMQHNVIFGTTPYGFPLEYKILPEFLKDLGYSTRLVGKWHMGHFQRSYTPTCRGFDSHYGHWTGHKDYYDNMAQEEGPQAWGYDMRRNLEPSYENFGQYTTDLYTKEATSIIRNHDKTKPLFLTISHTAVHSANPYQLLQAPKEYVDRFASTISEEQRRIYAGMTAKLDESVGFIVKELFEAEMLDNSIIIFTTDNGGPAAGFNGNQASNWPLRGVKNTLWEGGVRGAGLIWSPFIEKSARGVSKQMIHIQDWLPTILKAVGVYEPEWITGDIDGIDLWDVIRLGLTSPRTEVLHNMDDIYGNEAVRLGPWKLLHGTTYGGKWDGWYGPSGRKRGKKHPKLSTNSSSSTVTVAEKAYLWASHSAAGKAIRQLNMFPKNSQRISEILRESEVVCNETVKAHLKKNKKAVCNLLSGEYCLFNIEEDPCEYKNLASEQPEILKTMKEALLWYREAAVPPINKPKDDRGLPIHWNYTWTNFGDYLGQSETTNSCR